MNAKAFWIVAGVLFMISRFYLGILDSDPEAFWFRCYKTAAHLYMGGLFVVWWRDRKSWQSQLFWSLNFVEVSVAFLTRI